MTKFNVGDRVINKVTGVKGIVDKVEYFIAIDNYQAFVLGNGESWELFSESGAHKLATAVEALKDIAEIISWHENGYEEKPVMAIKQYVEAALEKINKKESKDDQV